MGSVSRQEIFARAARKLRESFAELTSVPHSGLKGGEAEKLVRIFLDQHLPKRFATGAGFILDPRDDVSPQTDVIVYDALHCPVYRASDDAGIFPSNNVAAVVEVKSRLDKVRVVDGFDKVAAVKKLAKVRTPEIGAPVADQTLGVVFGFDSDLSLDKLAEHYVQLLQGKPFGLHTDLVVVLDQGIISLAASLPGTPDWGLMIAEGLGGQAAEGAHIGVAVQELGENTLDVFLRLLLAQLSIFRGIVDHPGFVWSTKLAGNKMKLTYLASVTNEKDPVKRKERLEAYAELAKRDFARHPVPDA